MPKPLSDVYIRHGINLTRYSNYEAQRLIKLLDTANTQIKGIVTKAKAVETKEKYRRVAAEIERVTKECGEQLDGQLKLDFMELAEAETAFTAKALRGAGVKADFTLPSAAKIWSAASFGTYAGYSSKETYESYLNTLCDDLNKVWDKNVRAGYMAGLTAREINRIVLGSVNGLEPGQMQKLRNSLEMNTKTMISHLTETARSETYRKNSHLFSGYRYLGVLDSRACLECSVLDGKFFEGSEVPTKPEMPQHPRCRCMWIPVVKGMEEIDPDDTRASADGPVSANMTYSDWLKTQPESVQRDILGPARFEMYKNGEPISGFVADGRVMTLKQLREADIDIDSDHYTNKIYQYLKSETEHSGEKYDIALEKEHEMLIKETEKWRVNITEDELNGIREYASNSYREMTLALLGKGEMTDELKMHIDNCSNALRTYKLEEDIITWKGTRSEYFKDYQVGKTINYPAFHSSAVKSNHTYYGDMIIQFRIPKGTEGAYIGVNGVAPMVDEDEFTIQKGLNYKVIERNKIIWEGREKHYLVLEVANNEK